MHNHTFGLPIKAEKLNTGNTGAVSATQLFNQNNTLTAFFPIFT
jgi:hypothetical protein